VARVITALVGGDDERFQSAIAFGANDWPAPLDAVGAASYAVPLFPSTLLTFLRALRVLRKIVREERFDVIHSHHRFSSLVGRAAAVLSGARFVSSVHDFAGGNRFLSRMALGRDIMVYGQSVAQYLRDYFGLREACITKITMGVALPERDLRQSAAAFRSEWKIPAGAKVIAFAGRLDFEKGPDLLLEALPLILQASPNAVLCFAGDGPMRLELARSPLASSGDRPVRFLGWRERIDDLLAAADVVVVPSRSEAFGLTALEAMLRGRAVVASRVGGLPLLIEDGRTGVLFTSLTPESLAEGVTRVLTDSFLAARLGEAARHSVEDAYSVRAMVAETHQVYRDLLRRRSA
jgi:glycosyltransferase involved in cell wall biosynthesis